MASNNLREWCPDSDRSCWLSHDWLTSNVNGSGGRVFPELSIASDLQQKVINNEAGLAQLPRHRMKEAVRTVSDIRALLAVWPTHRGSELNDARHSLAQLSIELAAALDSDAIGFQVAQDATAAEPGRMSDVLAVYAHDAWQESRRYAVLQAVAVALLIGAVGLAIWSARRDLVSEAPNDQQPELRFVLLLVPTFVVLIGSLWFSHAAIRHHREARSSSVCNVNCKRWIPTSRDCLNVPVIRANRDGAAIVPSSTRRQ